MGIADATERRMAMKLVLLGDDGSDAAARAGRDPLRPNGTWMWLRYMLDLLPNLIGTNVE